MARENRYNQLIEEIFFADYKKGVSEFEFKREKIEFFAQKLNIQLPKNLGDLIYTFRYRTPLPERIIKTCPRGKRWVILPAGRGVYKFALEDDIELEPNKNLIQTKIPDSTPGIISNYALNDEQALLAKIRYNRLIDIFTRITCYSLQNHLRTTVPSMGQVETDEIYVGLDREGVHYVLPVQAKGGKDKLNTVQIQQDLSMCLHKFPILVCRPIGAQFLSSDTIVLYEFAETEQGIRIVNEKHYSLTPPEKITKKDLETYRKIVGDE